MLEIEEINETETEETYNVREILCEAGYEESVLFDNPDFDTAIVGVTEEGQVVYDYYKMVEQLQNDEGITWEEAIAFIEYNTMRALAYQENPPIVMRSIKDLQ